MKNAYDTLLENFIKDIRFDKDFLYGKLDQKKRELYVCSNLKEFKRVKREIYKYLDILFKLNEVVVCLKVLAEESKND